MPRYANGINDPTDRLPLWHSHEHEQEGIRSRVDNLNSDDEKCHGHTRGERTLVDGRPDSRSSSRVGKKRKDNFDPEAALPDVKSDIPLKPARDSPESTIFDFIPLLRFFRWVIHVILRKAAPGESRHRKARHVNVESNVPLEIALFLNSYTACK